MSLGDLTKLPAVVLCLGEPEEVFEMLLVVFSSMKVYIFLSYFSLPPALHAGFSGPWRSPPALSSALDTFGCFTFARFFCHIFTASATFLSGHFLPTELFFTFHSFLLFFGTFCDSVKRRTRHPGSSSVPAFIELSLPADAWTWTIHIAVTRALICRLRKWATKYRVKIELLNMFRLFKVI